MNAPLLNLAALPESTAQPLADVPVPEPPVTAGAQGDPPPTAAGPAPATSECAQFAALVHSMPPDPTLASPLIPPLPATPPTLATQPPPLTPLTPEPVDITDELQPNASTEPAAVSQDETAALAELEANPPLLSDDVQATQILNALASGVDISAELAATAAGLTGGGGEEAGFGFVRLDRISESTTNPDFAFDQPSAEEGVVVQELTLTDNPISLGGLTPASEGGDALVLTVLGPVPLNEDDLPGGSDASKESLVANGDFFITAPDGVRDLSINGVLVIDNGVFTPTTIATPLGNTLVVSGFDPITGVVTYSYELNTEAEHPADDGTNNRFEDLSVVAHDSDGDEASGTLTVRIVDDVPDAVDDSASLDEDTDAIVGNLMSNDLQGADGASVSTPGVFQGEHGVLTVASDGSWSYDLDETSDAVQGLGDEESFSEQFAYTLTDSDGDSDAAVLTITIHGVDDPVRIGDLTPADQGGDAVVDEDDLPAGSDPDKESTTVSGTFTLTAGDDIATLSIDGAAISLTNLLSLASSPLSFDSSRGTLTLVGYSGDAKGGTVSYTYTLSDAQAHPEGAGENNLFDDFALLLTDEDGDSAAATLSVRIIDDVPTASDDSAALTEDTDSISGNVMANDVQGADGASVGAQLVAGEHGTLSLAADGSWTYDLDDTSVAVQGLGDDENFTEHFDYTLTDGDADPSQATLTITIQGVDDPPAIGDLTPREQGGDTVVDEDDLPNGSDPSKESLSGTGTFTITAVDGVGTLSIAGHVYTLAELQSGLPLSFTTDLGNSFTVTGYDGGVQGGTVSYGYTLNDNETHDPGDGQNHLFEDLALALTDDDGDVATGTLSVRIVDDVPTALDDSASLDEDTDFITGNVLGNDVQGADDADVSSTGVFAGSYGSLSLAADGAWTYDLNESSDTVQGLSAGESLSESFDYTIVDGDSDPSAATLSIVIHGVNDVPEILNLPPAEGEGSLVVDEDDLPDGSDTSKESLTVSGSFELVAQDGIVAMSVNGHLFTLAALQSGLPQTISTDIGELVLDGYSGDGFGGTVSYHYTLNDNADHPAAGEDGITEDFALALTDEDGEVATGTLTVTVIDDVPTASNDSAAIGEDSDFITGNVMGNDVQGADQAVVSTSGVFAGNYGNLTLAADGSWTYDLDEASAVVQGLGDGDTLTESFDYTLTDGDADSDPATLTITIHAADDPPLITDLTPKEQGGDTVVDEDDLPDGSDTSKESLSGLGTFTITAVDGVGTLSIAGHVYTLAELEGGLPQSFTTDLGNTFTVTGYSGDLQGGTVSYSYTLGDNEAHAAGAGQNDLFEDLALVLTDEDGDTATGTLAVRIVDDVPTAQDDAAALTEDSDTVSGNVMSNDLQGADGATVGAQVVAGAHGSLSLAADGSWTYDLDEASAAVQGLGDGEILTESFDYTLTDGDSDPSTATLTITINGVDDPPRITGLTPISVNEDDLPDGTDATKESLTGVGTFTITPIDGVASLTVDGHSYSFATLTGGLPQSFTTALGNTFTLTGFVGNEFGGVVSYSYTLNDNETHSVGAGQNELIEALAVILTDEDGDSVSSTLNVHIVDDVPVVNATTDLIYANASNPSPGGTGVFDYLIGADSRDSYSAVNSDFATISLSGTVGGLAISNQSVTWSAEDDATAVFAISFDYAPNPDAPATTETATGTLSFNKTDGSYTVALDEPIQSFSIETTSKAISFTGYELGSATEDHTQPAVSVAELSNDFFVQFTGYTEPAGGTGANNLQALGVDGDGTHFVNGELFAQDSSWVSVTNTENGVAGDTLQQGEVLDMDFFTSNPQGDTTLAPTARASGMFLKFDGIGSEDLVVVLKLISADGASSTTRAINIQNNDILTVGAALPALYGLPADYLDNNDGVVFIESNDFNGAGENWLISGAQVLVSVEGISGEAIDLNSATGDGGGSSTTSAFGEADTDNDVIKISDIGFVTVATNTVDASLSFDVTLVDTDGDSSATQTLDVAIVNGTVFTGSDADESIQGSSGADTLSGGGGNDWLSGGLGADVFAWQLGDEGSTASPAVDTITDFDGAAPASGGDVLDLADLLVGETSGTLDDFLHFSASSGDTNIDVSTTGTVASSHDQVIILADIDLTAGGTLSDADIIANLVSQNKLIADV